MCKEVMAMTMRGPVSTDALEIEVSASEDRTVVALRGELDASGASRLYEEFSVVVAEHKRARHDGGGLRILSPNRRVIRLFQVSGLMSYLVVHPRMSV